MILSYYDNTRNFGDLLNPLIFHYYLPEFFDNNPETIFLGIGTILGLKKGTPATKKIIVFSSGYGKGAEAIYGKAPHIDSRYEFICVRGPLTAEHFKLAPSLAISDGALLLKNMPFAEVAKSYDYSYMPHHVSEGIYNGWRQIIESAGMHYISPQGEPLAIIEQIRKTKVLLTEAMHGAIVADVFRVPWIPVNSSAHINKFKWNDWALTLNLNIELYPLPSLFSDRIISELISKRFSIAKYKPINYLGKHFYKITRQKMRLKKLKNDIRKLKTQTPYVSDEKIVEEKVNLLIEKIEFIKKKYSVKSI